MTAVAGKPADPSGVGYFPLPSQQPESPMPTARLGTTIVALAAFASVSHGDAQVMEDRTAAVEAASAWLTLVDRGAYAKSWDEAAELFRGAMGRDRWVTTLGNVRAPLGTVLTRTVGSAEFTTELPGAPPGAYVVIQFETSFANLPNAVETVTPMRDPDGNWRVAGYFIRQAP